MNPKEFTDKELRDISSFETSYSHLLECLQERYALSFALYEKTVKKNLYLYEQKKSSSSATSLGPMNEENKKKLLLYKERKESLDKKITSLSQNLQELIQYVKIAKINKIDRQAAKILRRLDVIGALGVDVLVVGTNAFAAYEIHAQQKMFDTNMSTDDFDLTWYYPTAVSLQEKSEQKKKSPIKLLSVLKEIDESYSVGVKKKYQAVNSKGYEVELLASPSAKASIPQSGGFDPIALPEQEWLLKGTPVRHILLSQDNNLAPICAPDPRWMALHKVWLSRKPERSKQSVTKAKKDYDQGSALFELVVNKMPYDYPIDDNFISQIPPSLMPTFKELQKKYMVTDNCAAKKFDF